MENVQDPGSSTAPVDASSENATNVEAGGADQTVSYETHKRLLSQRKRDQERLRSIEDELNQFKTSQQAAEEAKLKEQGEYKKILESREKELAESRQRLHTMEKDQIDTYKLNAFMDKLGGKIRRPEYYSFVGLEDIAIDPDTRRVDELTLESEVKRFKETYPDLVDFGGPKKNLPGDAPLQGMSEAEAYMHELRGCTTQQQLDAVRKKYGRSDR